MNPFIGCSIGKTVVPSSARNHLHGTINESAAGLLVSHGMKLLDERLEDALGLSIDTDDERSGGTAQGRGRAVT